MARQISKVLRATRLEEVPEVAPDICPKAAFEIVALNLFDIDPYAEPEGPLNIDLDLDQIEDPEEE